MFNLWDWDTVQDVVGCKVLVQFGNGYIESATIHDDGEGPYYIFFDGDALDDFKNPPVGWRAIPDGSEMTAWENLDDSLCGIPVLIEFDTGHYEKDSVYYDEDGYSWFGSGDFNIPIKPLRVIPVSEL